MAKRGTKFMARAEVDGVDGVDGVDYVGQAVVSSGSAFTSSLPQRAAFNSNNSYTSGQVNIAATTEKTL